MDHRGDEYLEYFPDDVALKLWNTLRQAGMGWTMMGLLVDSFNTLFLCSARKPDKLREALMEILNDPDPWSHGRNATRRIVGNRSRKSRNTSTAFSLRTRSKRPSSSRATTSMATTIDLPGRQQCFTSI